MTPAEFRAARKRLGLTQAQLGAMLRYERAAPGQTISDIERGTMEASAPVVGLLRAYLDGYRPEDWPKH